MIDWLTIKVPFRHLPISSGRIVALDQNGTIEWEAVKRYQHKGSFDVSVSIKSSGHIDHDGNAQFLEISGNPSKFLQGQNVFGSDDINLLVVTWFKRICLDLDIFMTVFDLYRISRGDYYVTRIDINYMYQLKNSTNPNVFLTALAETSGTKFRKAYSDRGSVYFNKGSRRWSCVWYYKSAEIKVRKKNHRQNCEQKHIFALSDLIKNAVRCEIRLLSLELREKKLVTGYDLEKYGISNLFIEYVSRLNVSGNVMLSDKELNNLDNTVRGTYLLWKAGQNCRDVMSRATFYRHKKILRQHGINIDDSCRNPGSNVVSITRVINAEPISIPKYCYDHDLVIYRRAV